MNAPSNDTSDLSFDQLMELERRADERAASGDDGSGSVGDGDGSDGGSGSGDDVVVLPWWQHPINIATMVVTAAILAAIAGWMVGDARSGPDHNEVDVGFLQDMRVHHEQAVFMGFIFRDLPDTNPDLRLVAAGIVRDQNIDIGRMVQLLREFGAEEARPRDEPAMTWMGMIADADGMPGMASDAEIDALIASSGTDADRLFVELMTEHHVGGIEMAEFAAERARNDQVRRMAAAMAKGQRGEIHEMEQLLD